MPKKTSKLRPDVNETAYNAVQAMLGEGPRPEPPATREKSAEAVRRGSKGGKRGGRERAEKLTQQERSAIASKAARARWERKD